MYECMYVYKWVWWVYCKYICVYVCMFVMCVSVCLCFMSSQILRPKEICASGQEPWFSPIQPWAPVSTTGWPTSHGERTGGTRQKEQALSLSNQLKTLSHRDTQPQGKNAKPVIVQNILTWGPIDCFLLVTFNFSLYKLYKDGLKTWLKSHLSF